MVLADILSMAYVASAHATTMPISAAQDSNAIGIEYTISLGNLLTIASFIVIVTAYVVISRGVGKLLALRLETVDATLEDFKLEMKKLADIIIEQTRQEGRINLIEQRLMQEGQRLDDFGRNLGDFKNLMIKEKLSV